MFVKDEQFIAPTPQAPHLHSHFCLRTEQIPFFLKKKFHPPKESTTNSHNSPEIRYRVISRVMNPARGEVETCDYTAPHNSEVDLLHQNSFMEIFFPPSFLHETN